MYQITDQTVSNPLRRMAGSPSSVQPFSAYSSSPGTAHPAVRHTTPQLNAARCSIARATSSAANGAKTKNVGNSVIPTPYTPPSAYKYPALPVRWYSENRKAAPSSMLKWNVPGNDRVERIQNGMFSAATNPAATPANILACSSRRVSSGSYLSCRG